MLIFKKGITGIFLILLSGTTFFLGKEFEEQSLHFRAVSGYIIPDARSVKIASLGFHNLVSDILAVQAISSLYVIDKLDPEYWKDAVKAFKELLKGHAYESHRQLDVVSFSRYAYIASYLDPFDADRIEVFVLLMDWALDFPEGSVPILEYAARKNTSNWKLPYYLALNYLINSGDRQRAIYWLREASSRPGAAGIVKSLLIDVASEGNSRENILSGLASLNEVVKDKDINKRIDETIHYFKKGGVIKRVDWEAVREKIKKLREEERERE